MGQNTPSPLQAKATRDTKTLSRRQPLEGGENLKVTVAAANAAQA